MSDGSRRSDLLIGGVIGGTAAAVVAAVIVIVIVRLCRQWRQYQKAVQSALGELQCHSPDGMAIALTSTARRDSLIGMCFSILFSFSSCLWCLLCRFSHHLNLITVYYSNGCVALQPVNPENVAHVYKLVRFASICIMFHLLKQDNEWITFLQLCTVCNRILIKMQHVDVQIYLSKAAGLIWMIFYPTVTQISSKMSQTMCSFAVYFLQKNELLVFRSQSPVLSCHSKLQWLESIFK